LVAAGIGTEACRIGNRLSVVTGVQSYRYDGRSPVIETSSTGAIVKRNSYAPYGEAYAPTVIDGTGYTGHVMDQATGLTYAQQRYYDPQVGRFLSVDPAGSEFNRYSYAANNPYRFTDPDGRSACETGADGGCSGSALVHSYAGGTTARDDVSSKKGASTTTTVSATKNPTNSASNVGKRAMSIDNPGAVFDEPDSAAGDVLSQMNPISIKENSEYLWANYSDSATGKFGYTDPYNTGPTGSPKINLPITLNGNEIRTGSITITGIGHTHGDYSLANGTATTKSRDAWDSDHFSRGTGSGKGSDMYFMRGQSRNGSGMFYFELGTPSGQFFQWTPWGGVEPIPH
jgi:RHS repeat-associated protein